MIEEIHANTQDLMEKALKTLHREFGSIRTGRANPSILEGIRVNYYGNQTPISQMATITVPESRLLVIQPWDTSVIGEVEKAIIKSDLGLVPSNDGKLLRIPIPELTEERRNELVKVVRKIAEKERVSVRNVRRDANEHLKKAEKEKKISEDEMHRAHEEIQKLTDKYIDKIEKIVESKEEEILIF